MNQKRVRNRRTNIIYAWDGNVPIYATERQLDWQRRAAALRVLIEALPDQDPRRPELVDQYMAVLCEDACFP